MINLYGNVASEKDNAALKLREWLDQDRRYRRFSIISFDCDAKAAKKAVTRLFRADLLVGHVSASDPDFELANFTVAELKDVAIRIDQDSRYSTERLLNAATEGIRSGKLFQQWYATNSLRRAGSLKGELWGKALGAYALEHPMRPDTEENGPSSVM